MINTNHLKAQESEKQAVFLKNLRTVTGPAHEALEQNRYTSVLMTPGVSLQDYIAYLKRMYGFVQPAETMVYAQMHSMLPDVAKRRKAGHILSDLRALDVPEQEIAALPLASLEGNYDTIAAKAALMYVLEGSSLGGNVIFRHLQKNIFISPEKGAAYLTAYGADTGIMWKQFISAFSAMAVAQNFENEVTEAAAATFSRIDHWLTGNNNAR